MSDSKNDVSKPQDIYGSFFIAENEFAISVNFVQEVVNPPVAYSIMPLSPTYLKGLFNLRGTVVPVVDLRVIFQIKGEAKSEEQKIAIVEMSGIRLGLLFDRTGELFKSKDEERTDFETRTDDQLIQGVFKKDQGQRIVQILNISAALKLEQVPHQKEISGHLQDGKLSRSRGQRLQCISFLVGRSRCAIGVNEIQEILKVEKLSQSVLSAKHCVGNINLRGNIVPVIDLAAFFGDSPVDISKVSTDTGHRILVMKIENELIGLMVSSVESIVSYFPDELVQFPILSSERTEMFSGCIISNDGSGILLLNHQKILTDKEISVITQGHSKLYQANQERGKNQKDHGGSRKTYISFAVEDIYAVAIDQVNEIIDYPKEMLHPPGLPAHFRGVLNLRDELVTIVDARSMYALDPRPEGPNGKVMIFKRQGVNFGLVVDSVEAIVTFGDSDKLKIPDVVYKNNVRGLAGDVIEAVSINLKGDQKTNLLIINIDTISSRVERSSAAV